MADIFISYASRDREAVAELAEAVKRIGFTVWWDSHLLPHDKIEASICAEIDAAKAVVVIWSPASLVSDWVKSEAERARRQGKLVNVLHGLTAASVPMPFDQVHATPLVDRGRILQAAQLLVENGSTSPAVSGLSVPSPHFITEAISEALNQAGALAKLLKKKGRGNGIDFALQLRAAAERLEEPLRLFRDGLPYGELRSYANRLAVDRLDRMTARAYKECVAEINWLTRNPDSSSVVDGARADLGHVAEQILDIGSAPQITREGADW